MSEGPKLENVRNRIFFYFGFLILIVLTIVMIEPFITTIIISLFSVVLLKPLYNYYLKTKLVKNRRTIAVSLTLLSFILIIIVPVYLVTRITVDQLSAAFAEVGTEQVDAILQSLSAALGGTSAGDAAVEGAENLAQSIQNIILAIGVGLAGWILDLASSIPTFIVHAIIFIAIVASLLPIFDDVLELSQRVSPIGYELGELYNRKITSMVTSLVKGVFLIALIQGVAMGFFYWLAGMDFVFLLMIISILLAIIPMVGISWLVIFIAVLSFLAGNPTQAIIVLVGFYGVVNWIDIILRPKFISEEAHLQSSLFLLSIFAGIVWAGIMGLFYGPIIMLLLVTTVQIYVEEFAQEDSELIGSAFTSRMKTDDQ